MSRSILDTGIELVGNIGSFGFGAGSLANLPGYANSRRAGAVEAGGEGKAYGFDESIFDFIATGPEVVARSFNGYWLDIGRPDDYLQAIEEFETMKSRFVHD